MRDWAVVVVKWSAFYSDNPGSNRVPEPIKKLDLRKKTILNKLKQELEKITPWKLNLYKVTNIGQVMKCFYNIHSCQEIKNTLSYSFGFHGYIDNIDK